MKRPQVVSAAVAGTSHLRRDLPCQDAVAWQVTAGGRLLAALADGAGSAALAEAGAAAAVAGAIAHLQSLADTETLGATATDWGAALVAALAAARGRLVALAEERQSPLREAACTAIVLVADQAGVAVAQVGDGAAILLGQAGANASAADGHLRALTVPPVGEYANVCPFLSDEDWESALQSQAWAGPVAGVALFSDGLQRVALKLPEGEPFAPFFAPLFAFVEALGGAIAPDPEDDRRDDSQDPPEGNPQAIAPADESLAAFLRSPRLSERTDDDLSLLLAVWPSP